MRGAQFRKADGRLDGDALLVARKGGARWVDLAAVAGVRPPAVIVAAKAAAERRGEDLPSIPKGKRQITRDEERQAFELRAQGLTWRDVARELHMSLDYARIATACEAERRGVKIPAGPSRGLAPRINAALGFRLRQRGRGWSQIAGRIGASSASTAQRAVTAYARERALAMPKIAPPPPKPQATISGKRALHLFHVRRFNWTQIGRILGCSSSGASIAAEREAKRRGIRLRRRQRVWIDAGRVLALRRKGMSWDAIAIKLRCSPSGARVAAYRNGYREEE